jgi:hypothetical protein
LKGLVKMAPPLFSLLHAVRASLVHMLIATEQGKGAAFCGHAQVDQAANINFIPT